MSETLAKAKEWAHSHEGRKLIRYTAVSGISTVVSFFTLFIVFGVLKLWGEVVSTVVANLVATVPSYYLNRTWAWGKTGRSHVRKEVIPFACMSLLGIAVSIVGASVARHIGTEHHFTHAEQTLVVLIANLVSFGVFWIAKLLVFNKLFHFELEEFDEHLTIEEHSTPEGV